MVIKNQNPITLSTFWSTTSTVRMLLCLFNISGAILQGCIADNGSPLQDTCPTLILTSSKAGGLQDDQDDDDQKNSTSTTVPLLFVNGFPCKNPAAIVASDFKSSEMKRGGDTDNFLRSAMSTITAGEFPGLNTLGLSMGRTDIDVDGMVQPHSHPRASEVLYVTKGVVVVGFVDTRKRMFQKMLREGDVFVFPRGLFHYSVNAGFEPATTFSILNGQNPGVVRLTDAMFGSSLCWNRNRTWTWTWTSCWSG